jgi:hypothetical protein
MAELDVQSSDDGETVTFTFSGGPQLVLAVAMIDEAADEPVWVLTVDTMTETFPFTVGSADPVPLASSDEARVESELLARGVDPRALDTARKAARPLETFQYGKVPPGFRQAMPARMPTPLQRGKRYWVTAMGAIGVPVAQISFTA